MTTLKSICAWCMATIASILIFSADADGSGQTEANVADPLIMSFSRAYACGSAAVGDMQVPKRVDEGRSLFTPGHLDANWEAGIALACQSQMATRQEGPNADPGAVGVPIVYAFWANEDKSTWTAGYFFSKEYGIATFGDVAILPDARAFLLSTVRYRGVPHLGDHVLPNDPPFHVRKFAMPAHPTSPKRLDVALASFETDGVAAQIELTRDGSVAHILTDRAVVHSIRTDTMTEIAPPVPVPPLVNSTQITLRTTLPFQWADLSLDERYLITNQGRSGSITVVDLQSRTARSIALSPEPAITGGIALNSGWVNRGLLAVHHSSQVAVYPFDPTAAGPLVALASAAVPTIGTWDPTGIHFSIRWNGMGDKLVATTSAISGNRIYTFSPQTGLEVFGRVDTCTRIVNDLWTANGVFVPSPTPTSSPLPTATPTITPTPSVTPPPSPTPPATLTAVPSPTPSATPPPTLTPTPTPIPGPIYLPLSLRERCSPEREPVDVVLAVDTSSSMEERTAAGVRKLTAAVDAAGTFLDLMRLDAGDRAAVVSFDADARLVQRLTADRAALDAALGGLRTAQLTCLPCAVDVSAAELAAGRRAGAMRVLVLLTDGRSNPRPASEAVAGAAAAKDVGVTVFTIGLGADLDTAALAEMASFPAAYLPVADAGALAAAYAEVARTLPCPPGAYWGGR